MSALLVERSIAYQLDPGFAIVSSVMSSPSPPPVPTRTPPRVVRSVPGLGGQAVDDHLAITRLKDMERQDPAGEEHCL